jgi:enoyl-[acyl-carrier protein] reductase III
MTEFKDTWAVILGGSSGLGLATAHKLAAHGMNICIVHRDRKSDLAEFNKEVACIKANGVQLMSFNKDGLTEGTIKEVVDSLPEQGVKVLVHSIAKGSLKPLNSSKENSMSKGDLDITLHAMGTSWYQWTKALVDAGRFIKNSRNIAFTSEGNAKVWPGYAAVSAAKATLESLMRSMAVELAPLGIRTNCIQAGATETPSFKMIPGSDQLADTTKKRNPFGRLTQPEDVANAVYLLCKKEADWINGTVLKVDGGESLR